MAEPYFIWNGTDSRNMGVVVRSYPPIVRPKERVQERPVPGRPGALNMVEGVDIYETYVRSCQCYTRPTANLNNVINWLRGFGTAVFGNEPTMAYTVKIDNQISLEKILANHEHRDFLVPFVCQPFKYQATPSADTVITTSGGTITNPGTVASIPIIKVEGSGDITLTVGGLAVELTGIVDGIIIDCTLPDCLNLSRTALINDKLTGALEDIRLPVGESSVHWTGTVSKVTITPNWRWL